MGFGKLVCGAEVDPRTGRIAWSASEFKLNAAWLFENSLTSPFSH